MKGILYNSDGHDREINVASAADILTVTAHHLLWIDALEEEWAELRQTIPLLNALPEFISGDLSIHISETHYKFSVPLMDTQGRKDESVMTFLVCNNILVTLAPTPQPYMAEFIEQDNGETLKGAMDSAGLVASILLRHFARVRILVGDIHTAIDQLDEAILRMRQRRPPLGKIAVLRRRVSNLRRLIFDHRQTMQALVSPEMEPHQKSPRQYEVAYRDFERLEDEISRARDIVVATFELYTTRVAQDTNQLIKTLTILTVLIGAMSAVAGIFGMNFDTPYSHTGLTGFFAVVGGTLTLSVAVLIFAHWKEWL